MKRINDRDLIKIGELSKAAKVSISSIHYYVQEGLLTPPIKTSRNMAYYDPRTIEEIRLIQELQTKRFFPLSAIKLILQAKREGQRPEHVKEMHSLMENIFRPLGNETTTRNVSLAELATVSGLSEPAIKSLESKGLIVPIEDEGGLSYDDIDIRLAQIFKKLMEYGIKLNNLDIYRQYLDVMRSEVKAMHNIVHSLPDHEKIPLMELFNITNDLKNYLAIGVYRQEAQHFHEHEPEKGAKNEIRPFQGQ